MYILGKYLIRTRLGLEENWKKGLYDFLIIGNKVADTEVNKLLDVIYPPILYEAENEEKDSVCGYRVTAKVIYGEWFDMWIPKSVVWSFIGNRN